jgi:hypothetical protein
VAFGSAESVVVEADDNIVPLLETHVQAGRLIISNPPRTTILADHPIRVHVTVKALNMVSLPGSGGIRVSGFSGDTLKVDLPGSGSIAAAGTAGHVEITLSGSGNIICGDLKAGTVNISLSGSGDVTVYAIESLDVKLSGTGSIHYGGNPPTVTKNITGAGSVEPQP